MRLCYVESVAPEKVPKKIQPSDVYKAFRKHMGVDLFYVVQRNKSRLVTYKRNILIFLLYKHANITYKEIGNLLFRDHTTALDSANAVKDWIDTDYSTTRSDIKAIEKILGV